MLRGNAMKRFRINGLMTGLLLFTAASAYAASTVEMYKDPG
jgi:hypothetical protein